MRYFVNIISPTISTFTSHNSTIINGSRQNRFRKMLPMGICFNNFVCHLVISYTNYGRFFTYLPINLPTFLPIYLPICLSVCRSVCRSACRSACLSIYLYISLPLYMMAIFIYPSIHPSTHRYIYHIYL